MRYVICKCKAVISSCNNTLLIDIPNRPCGSETLLDTSLVIQSLYNFCEMILRSLKFAIFFCSWQKMWHLLGVIYFLMYMEPEHVTTKLCTILLKLLHPIAEQQ